MIRAVYLPGAEEDIVATHADYERRSPGLGDRFALAVRIQVGIMRMPEMYAEVGDRVRAAPLAQFPYVVYYRVEEMLIVIMAVTHGRQKKQGWENRG